MIQHTQCSSCLKPTNLVIMMSENLKTKVTKPKAAIKHNLTA